MADPTGSIRLNIVDGTRNPFPQNTGLLLRILDGRKQLVASPWVKGPTILVNGLPFYDDASEDAYKVFVHGDGYGDAGPFPVHLRQGQVVDVYLMLLPKDGSFRFSPIADVQADPLLYGLVANGAAGSPADRYTKTIENYPLELGGLLTIGTAIRDLPLDDGKSPLQYYWEVIWDLLMPDRFWAWVDARLAGRIADLAKIHSVAEEKDAAHFHPGIPGRAQPATRSWKQVRFDVSNVQLTFHETNKRTVTKPDGSTVDCVIIEPDIDYCKDLLAHGLLEVLPHLWTGGTSDPREDYRLRWMPTKAENVQPDFGPPLTVQ